MRPLRAVAAAAALSAVLLGATGCTGAGDDPAAGTAPASSPTGPTPAGSAEAAVLAQLPDGAATGTAVLAWSGAGEVRAPFAGTCSANGDSMTIDGQADTARIQVEAAPDGVRLAMDDLGVSATADLATGRYDVSGGHLSLAAPLVSDGQPVGSVELEVDCGG